MSINTEMKTFKDLYLFLQTLEDSSIIPFLEENWIGKEKQESLFRLFSLLKLFSQFKNYYLCEGNFNNKTIHEMKSVSLYLDNKLKDSGDYSDLTLRSDKVVIAISRAKPLAKEQNPKFFNIVENLCITAGLSMPRIYVIESPALNAFATGRNAEHAVIAVTTGLLELFTQLLELGL